MEVNKKACGDTMETSVGSQQLFACAEIIFPTFTVWQSKMPSIKRSSLSQYNPGYFFGQILLAGCVDSFLELSVSEKVPVSPRDPITF